MRACRQLWAGWCWLIVQQDTPCQGVGKLDWQGALPGIADYTHVHGLGKVFRLQPRSYQHLGTVFFCCPLFCLWTTKHWGQGGALALCCVLWLQHRWVGARTHWQTRQQRWAQSQLAETWALADPRPTRQCWVPLQRGGLEAGTHNFILFLHDPWPVPLSWFKGSLWKGLQ